MNLERLDYIYCQPCHVFIPILKLFVSDFRCTLFSSVTFMALIIFQRVVAIKRVKMAPKMFGWKMSCFHLCMVWLSVFLILLLPVFKVWGQLGHKDGYPYCFIWVENGTALTDPNKLGHIVGYSIPLLLLIISFCILGQELESCVITRTAVMVVGSFVFVYTPGFIVYIFNPREHGDFLSGLHVFTYILGKSLYSVESQNMIL